MSCAYLNFVGFEHALAAKVVFCTAGVLVSVVNVAVLCFIQDLYRPLPCNCGIVQGVVLVSVMCISSFVSVVTLLCICAFVYL